MDAAASVDADQKSICFIELCVKDFMEAMGYFQLLVGGINVLVQGDALYGVERLLEITTSESSETAEDTKFHYC